MCDNINIELGEREWGCMDLIDLEYSCEHGNESPGSIKCWKIPEQLNDWRLLKQESASWSQLVFMLVTCYCIVCVLAGINTPGQDRAIAQAVSRWFPTAAAQVRAQDLASGICGGQSGAGAGFLRALRFLLPIFIPPNSPSSQSAGASTIGH
jgi:hypothetical protein